MRVGIIGCGAIGGGVAKAVDGGILQGIRLVALSDRVRGRAEKLSQQLKKSPPVLEIEALIERCDLVVEAAHASLVPALLKKVVQRRKDLLILSTGGLLGQETVLRKARIAGCHILLPSGALFGIDGIKAAALLPIQKMILTTRKPPRSFEGAPFVLKNRIRLNSIRRERLLFRGNFKEAVKAFPQNINVAATLAAASNAPRRLEVRVIADPKARRNSHEVTLEGPAGTLFIRSENVPSKENPKTSRLAILSAVATLKALCDPVRIGT